MPENIGKQSSKHNQSAMPNHTKNDAYDEYVPEADVPDLPQAIQHQRDLSPKQMLYLQRTIGNHATRQVSQYQQQSSDHTTSTSSFAGLRMATDADNPSAKIAQNADKNSIQLGRTKQTVRKNKKTSKKVSWTRARKRGAWDKFTVIKFKKHLGKWVEVGVMNASGEISRSRRAPSILKSLPLKSLRSIREGKISLLSDNKFEAVKDDIKWIITPPNSLQEKEFEDILDFGLDTLEGGTKSFSGKGRTGADNQTRKNAISWKPKAGNAQIPFNTGQTQKDLDTPAHKYESTVSKNKIVNKIVHTFPWKKYPRGQGQAMAMDGWNAKGYIANLQGQKAIQGTGFEWLHLIGSRLGGPTEKGNLVAGSFDANTEMIPLESVLGNWSKSKKNTPSGTNQIEITAIADLIPDTYIATRIELIGKRMSDNKEVRHIVANPVRSDAVTLNEYENLENKYVDKNDDTNADISDDDMSDDDDDMSD